MLLDVREDDERAFCAISGVEDTFDLHIPLRQLVTRFAELALRRPKSSTPVVVYCHHGVRRSSPPDRLPPGLTDVYNLTGGIDAWSLEADPCVKPYH